MSSGFITEREVIEVRRKRQEEWERVRKAEDPIERPEEVYDHRSLFERLQEQKQKKDLEYEEAHKLKNMIKGLDDDEIEFLDLVDRTKLAADRKKTIEEEIELNDYRNRVASLQEKNLDQRLQSEINVLKSTKQPSNNRTSQTKLLKGVVVKKAESRKRKSSEMEDHENEQEQNGNDKKLDENVSVDVGDGNRQPTVEEDKDKVGESATCEGDVAAAKDDNSGHSVQTSNVKMRCIGILPGLGFYDDSSSDNSSDSDQEEELEQKEAEVKYDLCGRKIVVEKKET